MKKMEIFLKNSRKWIHIIFTAIFIISLNYKNYKLWLKRAPKWPSRCSFVNQELVLKAACRSKREPSQNFFLPFSYRFRSGVGPLSFGALKQELGPLRPGMGPPKTDFLLFIIFSLVRDFGSLPKK